MKKINKKIVFGEPCIDKNFREKLLQNLDSKWIGTGPISKEFEQIFSNYKKTKFSFSVNSCTSAIFLSLKSLNLKKSE